MAISEVEKIVVEIAGKVGDLIKALGEAELAEESFAKKTEDTNARTKKSSKESGDAVTSFARLVTQKLRDGETAFQSINREIDQTRLSIDRMRADFSRTGNESIFGDLKKAEADLTELENIAAEMEPSFKRSFGRAGSSAGSSLTKSIKSQVEKDAPNMFGSLLNTFKGASLMDFVLPLAPLIAAGIGAAVMTGVGGIGILIAGLIEKANPEVASAFAGMGQDIQKVMLQAASPMVSVFGEMTAQVDGWFQKEEPKFQGFFAALAPGVTPFIQLILNLVDDIMPGLTRLAKMFGEVMSDPTMTTMMNSLGQSINMFFDTIANNKDAVDVFFTILLGSLDAILLVVDALIYAFGAVVDVVKGLFDLGYDGMEQSWRNIASVIHGADTSATDLSKSAKAAMDQLSQIGYLKPQFADLTMHIGVLGDMMLATGSKWSEMLPHARDVQMWDNLTQEIGKKAVSAATVFGAAMDKVLGSLMNTDEATLHWHESLTGLSDALKQNGHDLDINHAKGQANREAILQAVQANIQWFDTMIQNGASQAQATKLYDDNTAALRRQLIALGYNATEVDNIIGKYKSAPKKLTLDVAINGLTKAINDLDDLIAKINGIPTQKAINIAFNNDVYGHTGDRGKDPGTQKPAPKGKPTPPPSTRTRSERFGGIESFAMPGIMDGFGQGVVKFAESSTKREAYIPEQGDYGASIAVLREAARWKGMGLRPLSAGMGDLYRSSAGAGISYVPIQIVVNRQVVQSIHAALIPVSQDYRRRNGTTGLESP